MVGDDKISTELKPLSEGVNNKHMKMVLDYKFNEPNDPNQIYFRSDHYNFARKGVPVIFYYDGMLKADYHKPTDTPDKINYNLHMKRTRLVFHTAWEMANREALMKRDLPGALGNALTEPMEGLSAYHPNEVGEDQRRHDGGIALDDVFGRMDIQLAQVIFSLGTAPEYEP